MANRNHGTCTMLSCTVLAFVGLSVDIQDPTQGSQGVVAMLFIMNFCVKNYVCQKFMTQPIRTKNRIAKHVSPIETMKPCSCSRTRWPDMELKVQVCLVKICLVYFSITQYQKRGKVLGTRNSRLRTCINYHQIPSTCLRQCCHCHKVRH